MQKNNSSLKSIAQRAGVSITTVHRALTGKKDCSDAMREKILKIAAEEGYAVNYFAASLGMKRVSIAVILSAQDDASPFFTDRLRRGFEYCRQEFSQFRIDYKFFTYSRQDIDAEFLASIASGKEGKFDAVLMHVLSVPEKYIPCLESIISEGIPVVAMECSPVESSHVITVGMDECTSGSLAGELISKLAGSGGKVIIFSQKMNLGDVNASFAQKEIMQRRGDMNVEIISLDPEGSGTFGTIKSYIEQKPAAIYASCARNTLKCINAMKETGIRMTFVGSEIFGESYKALQCGVLDAVIDNRPALIGYTALKILIDHLVKKLIMKKEYRLQPLLLLKSNSVARYEQVYRSVDVDVNDLQNKRKAWT